MILLVLITSYQILSPDRIWLVLILIRLRLLGRRIERLVETGGQERPHEGSFAFNHFFITQFLLLIIRHETGIILSLFHQFTKGVRRLARIRLFLFVIINLLLLFLFSKLWRLLFLNLRRWLFRWLCKYFSFRAINNW